MPESNTTSPPTGATIFWGDSRMHPRLPRSGKRHLCLASISLPISTARGPVRQDSSQGSLRTQGSSPCLQGFPGTGVAVTGAGQGGGGGGSTKAGSGKPKLGLVKQQPKVQFLSPLRQPRQE